MDRLKAVYGIWQQEHPVQRVNETNCFMRQHGGLLADLCTVAAAFSVIVESHGANVADRFPTIDARMAFREGITTVGG